MSLKLTTSECGTVILALHHLMNWLTTHCVKLFLTDYNAEKMVSSLNSELCNVLGDSLNSCTSKFINSSQIYPLLDHSNYDSMCNEEWSEVIHNLRELLGGYMKFSNCWSLFVCIPWLLATGGLILRGASPVHFISKYMLGGFLSRTLVFLLLLSSDDGMILIYYRVKIIMSFYFWQPNPVQKWKIHSIDILIRKQYLRVDLNTAYPVLCFISIMNHLVSRLFWFIVRFGTLLILRYRAWKFKYSVIYLQALSQHVMIMLRVLQGYRWHNSVILTALWNQFVSGNFKQI